ncbi:hypothetical protein BCIN_16g01750 [Botrytis cinerea B05.10]|uniref:Uncharacterized protein n=1 Tax=Botryotinia fuckeliana (strain B05.10) TaxID=332648 RepID=A0A384K6I1_BOTFB|nr:hypothetical protein BCIN_16g01750 [Botrytis cinerea B05.10]ATZ58371.1 hypothetical protein BCIN_16g01750 [Botrytis cinerea B05.10]
MHSPEYLLGLANINAELEEVYSNNCICYLCFVTKRNRS